MHFLSSSASQFRWALSSFFIKWWSCRKGLSKLLVDLAITCFQFFFGIGSTLCNLWNFILFCSWQIFKLQKCLQSWHNVGIGFFINEYLNQYYILLSFHLSILIWAIFLKKIFTSFYVSPYFFLFACAFLTKRHFDVYSTICVRTVFLSVWLGLDPEQLPSSRHLHVQS